MKNSLIDNTSFLIFLTKIYQVMKKQFISKLSVLVLCITISVAFVACSSDDDSSNDDDSAGAIIELSADLLDDYRGTLFDENSEIIPNDGSLISTATITETSTNTYMISFDNEEVSSISGLTFTATSSTIFVSQNTDRTIVISSDVFNDLSGMEEDLLTVSFPDTTAPLFGGTK